jgi:DNA-binding protein HU-beta
MKKKDAIAVIKEKFGYTNAEAEAHIDSVLDLIAEAVVTGDKEFNITGWGKFVSKDKPARKARNPKTGEEIDVPAKTVIKFAVGSKLKAAVAAGEALKISK